MFIGAGVPVSTHLDKGSLYTPMIYQDIYIPSSTTRACGDRSLDESEIHSIGSEQGFFVTEREVYQNPL